MFPGGVNSPVRAFKAVKGPPLFIRTGHGSKIYDEDDNEFVDFCCSWGPLILGHNHPGIKQAIIRTLENGTSFGTPTRHGNELGKMIISNHRYVEKLRFVSSGTEAVMSAIRLARGYTAKDKIIKFNGCYHGHSDSLLVKAGSGLATFGISSSAGIPEAFAAETLVLELNDLQRLEDTLVKFGDQIACIIIEPVPANHGLLLQDTNFLAWIRKLCDQHNVLLIFDEVISGFRLGFEGACGHYSIEPDLVTFGKIIGGGLPVGAFGGRSSIMANISPEGPVYQAGTLSANPITMAAGLSCLEECLKTGFYEKLEENTRYFTDLVRKHITKQDYPMRIEQIASIFWISFTPNRVFKAEDISALQSSQFALLHNLLLEEGIYMGPSGFEVGFVSAAHSRKTLASCAGKICSSLDKLYKNR